MKLEPTDRVLSATEKEEMYQQIVEYSFETTIIHSDHRVLYINQSGADFLGEEKEKLIGANVVEVFTEEYRDYIIERIRQGTEENKIGELIETKIYKMDGTVKDVELYCHPVVFGDRRAIQSIIRDITSKKETERKLQNVIGEVATSIVPVTDDIAILPLVGVVDDDRANQLLELIPQKFKGKHVEHLIIDVSGIYNITEVVAELLIKAKAVMDLLGTSVIYTGIRPELAQKAVDHDLNITSLTTMGDVKQALHALMAKV